VVLVHGLKDHCGRCAHVAEKLFRILSSTRSTPRRDACLVRAGRTSSEDSPYGSFGLVTAPSEAEETSAAYFAITPVS
jgi:hypothetical protein